MSESPRTRIVRSGHPAAEFVERGGTGTPGGEPSSALDEVIDAVAREMTNLEAPAGLRAEVMARVEESDPRRGFAWPRWALAAGAVVVVMAAVAMWRPIGPGNVRGTGLSRPEQRRGASPAEAEGRRRQPGVLEGTSMRGTGLSASPPSATTGPRRSSASEVAQPGVEDATADFGPPPLASPPPIAIDALGPGAIEIGELQVPALGPIQPLAIKDISIGSNEPQRR